MASTVAGIGHLQIPLEKILDATDNFSENKIIGKGDFGNVYRGKLEHDGKKIKIAARRLNRKHGQGDVEFWKEVSILSNLQDTGGIVNMIGFCDEKGEKVIVNEHYRKGSLLMYVSNPTFTWKQRLDIAEFLFWGIYVIHKGLGSEHIIHRNINSSTILIDDDGWPRLSGFEFSIKNLVEQKKRVIRSEAIGARGYIDPAIEKYGGVTYKSDIYAVGVVLFELLCGKKAYEENTLLAQLAKFHYENGTLKDIIHPDLWNQIDHESFESFSEFAYSCLQDEPDLRPDVEQLLERVMEAQAYHRMNKEEDKDDPLKILKDPLINKSSSDCWKVEKLEHLRIELTNIYKSPNISHSVLSSRDKYGNLYKREIECYDRERKSKDDVAKRHHTVTVKTIKYNADVSLREIEVLSSCKHPNIQSFLGFYEQDSTMMLFYEHVSFKYLGEYLYDGSLSWGRSLKICIDVAHGLDYLHNEMEDQKMVIHGDINSQSIELYDNWGARIVGFENSVILPLNQDDDSLQLTKIACDKYYIDPEYFETGKLKRESDVFSFGVVMLEILCGKEGPEITKEEGHEDKELIPLARRWFDEGTIKEKISPLYQEEYYGNNLFLNKGLNKDSLDAFITITYRCLAENQSQRPDMKSVIKELRKALSFHENHKDPLRMSFSDIKSATQGFNPANCIGGGGFGRVYIGKLAHGKDNGESTIVVKKLDRSQGQGEKQYYNELQIIYGYKHGNVIGLIGFSNETDEKLIVYEYASKGSLDKHLNNASLTWRNRLKICIDVATGLNFLHGGIQGQEVVIHRDIKASNILMFDDWKAKIGDFGLSLISPISKKTNFTIDHPCGTMHYVDPMYLKSGILTVESDVYSFGVALFEILCGRAMYTIPKDKTLSLLGFIKFNFENGKQDAVVFKAIKEEIVSESLTAFLNIVYKCLDDDREKRPTMKQILAQLEKVLEFQDKGKI